ncbi:MAG: type II toxin-antitoxin system VapC family toxin [Cytophagales bacterium]|nr:type II toxin-antitoxin system VapC family toxin [Rhizobacter sp.]
MILFCDTSALVKLYVHEDGTDAVIEQAGASDIVAVSRVAWVEAMSAMARRSREQAQDAAAIAQARQRLIADWPHYLVLEITQELVELAGDYAEAFALRAYDSVQLASAHLVHQAMPGEVVFACYDSRLVKAARALGLQSLG